MHNTIRLQQKMNQLHTI